MFGFNALEDYGDFQDEHYGIGRVRTSVLLCRRKHKLQLVFRTTTTSWFGAGVRYIPVDVSPQTLHRLGEVISDAKRVMETEGMVEPDAGAELPPRLSA